MTYTAASQQGAIQMFWLHFLGALRLSSFIYSLWDELAEVINSRLHFATLAVAS